MAIIKVEEYFCDFCSKPVKLDEVYIGTLAVRKRGSRGRRTEIELSMHHRCIPVSVIPSFQAKPNGVPVRRSRAAVKA